MRDLSIDALRRRRKQLEDDPPKAEAPTRGRESDFSSPGGRYDQMLPVVQSYYRQERRRGLQHVDALHKAIAYETWLEKAREEQAARERACAHPSTERDEDGVRWCPNCGREEDYTAGAEDKE